MGAMWRRTPDDETLNPGLWEAIERKRAEGWVRRRGIELALEDGISVEELAEAFDSTPGSIRALISKMRASGQLHA